MTDRVNKLYKSACKDKTFLDAIYDADEDKKPSVFADSTTKALFASLYYGYRVGKHGVNWKNGIF